MSSTVLLCTDGSETSLAALRAGLRQLAPHDRTVVVTVVEPVDETLVTGVSGFGAGSMSPAQYDELARQRRAEADQVLADTASALGREHDVRLDVRVLDGPAGPAICDAADELGADVIVMGTRGRGGLRRAVLGSVSDHVIRNASCSVLVTSTHAEHAG